MTDTFHPIPMFQFLQGSPVRTFGKTTKFNSKELVCDGEVKKIDKRSIELEIEVHFMETGEKENCGLHAVTASRIRRMVSSSKALKQTD